jgi:serine/threonine protein kinase
MGLTCVDLEAVTCVDLDAPHVEQRRSSKHFPPRAEYTGETVEYKLDELETLGLLGEGGYSTVTLVRCNVTGQHLALKTMSKSRLADAGKRPHMEKAAMLAARSPFLIRLAASFERGPHFYLLQEAALGGDLHSAYQRQNLYGSEIHARFYTACVVCALEHLHGLSIIFRDLKMENLVLDAIGICKLCDFGAAKFTPNPQEGSDSGSDDDVSKTYTLCGTPEYMAPEVVSGSGHYCAADWWSLGILLYELNRGETPFEAEDIKDVYRQILVGLSDALLPNDGSSWGVLVQGLCQKDSRQRLPMQQGGAKKVKGHQWFTEVDFDWEALEQCALPAPYVPKRDLFLDLPHAMLVKMPKVLSQEATWPGGFEESVGPTLLGF